MLKMSELGKTPTEIKEAVIESLEPYFENRDILEKYAIEFLVVESINLLKLKSDKWFFERFKKCISTYQLAKSINPQKCFESCALWQPDIEQSISRYWSVYYLEIDKNTLDSEEYLHECLRNIGDIIEGLTKPYLKALQHQRRIANGIETTLEDIITDMNLTHNILISIYPVSEIDYLTLKSPLLMNVRKEGVPT